MKKVVVILMLFVYGTATMGATVHLQFCMNKLVGWSLINSTSEECGRCGMQEDQNGCCKDEHKHFKLKAEHQIVSAAALKTSVIDQAIITQCNDLVFKLPLKAIENYSTGPAPPEIGKSKLHVLHCLFLI